MPIIKGRVRSDGGLVRVAIAWSQARARKLRLALRPVPPPIEAMALLDTGADISCLDAKLIEELELPYGGPVLANVPAFPDISVGSIYNASLTILHPSGNRKENLGVPNLSFLELPLELLGYKVIIGRDILARCLFQYNGIRRRFTLKH